MLVLSGEDVARCLPMPLCIEAMRDALIALNGGEVHNPLRAVVGAPFETAGILALMPVIRGGSNPIFALKEICVIPGNHARGLDSHQGSVLLHDGGTGELVAILNGSALTAIRTAAVTAVATDALARPDARVLAIVGSGIQARRHLESLCLVRAFDDIKVCSREERSAAAFADRWSDTYPVRACATVEEAVRGADVVCTVTTSAEPVLHYEWLGRGAHVNAVGASTSNKRELDSATIAAGSLFVDRRESTTAESGDYLLALADGAIEAGHIRAELGEVLAGRAPGRTDDDELTIFKSLGLAVEDMTAAEAVYRRALSTGAGIRVHF